VSLRVANIKWRRRWRTKKINNRFSLDQKISHGTKYDAPNKTFSTSISKQNAWRWRWRKFLLNFAA
jgi:hypothetical protein